MSRDAHGDFVEPRQHNAGMGTVLGKLLRDARVTAGLSQQNVGEQTGASRSAVNQWEAGRTKPDVAKIARLAATLNLDPAALLRAMRDDETQPQGGSSPQKSDISFAHPLRQSSAALPTLVVWKTAAGAAVGRGVFMLVQEKAGEVERPDFLEFAGKAFAIKVIDRENEPVYRLRDRVLVNPDDPVMEGDDCLFGDLKPPPGAESVIGRLIRSTPTLWIIEQYAAKGERELPRKKYPNAWPLVGRYIGR